MKTPISLFVGLTILALTLGPVSRAEAAQPAFFQTHHDKIPNFAQNPTITSAQNGSWTSTSTWSPARLPNANDVVLITHSVTYNSTSGNVDTIGIDAGGTLRFVTNQSTTLKVATLLVMPNGTLEIGKEGSPIAPNVQSEIIIKDKALDLTFDPHQFGTGILVIDGTFRLHGTPKNPSFVRLTQEPQGGDMTLRLEQPVSGWKPGDRLILPDTRQLKDREDGNEYSPQWEELILANVSSDGKTLTLSTPLSYDHLGAHDANGTLRFLPHVGNLSRNVVVGSENPSGTRGHTLLTHRAEVDTRYVQFKNMGRTTIDPLDSTTEDSNGTITHIGTNQIARYPFHTHHLIGAQIPPSSGNQFTVIGNSIDGGSQLHRFKAGVVIHGSHYGLIKQNIVYNAAGTGMATEQGSESFNVFEQNFVVRVSGPGGRADRTPFFGQGTGFWFRSVNDIVRDNVVANISPVNKTYAYVVFNKWVGTQHIPAFKGADPHIDGLATNMHALPLREFSRNEAYGALDGGMTFWWVGTNYNSPQNGPQSIIKDFRGWHIHRHGFWNYPVSNILIDGFTIQGNASQPGGTGLNMVDYLTDKVIVRNADIRGMAVGLQAPVRFADNAPLFTIENSFFQNKNNIAISYLWNCCTININPRKLLLRNIKFEHLGNFPYSTIAMNWIPEFKIKSIKADLIESTKVFVEDYNQNSGKNFQVFFKEQAPSTLVLQANDQHTGSEDLGLTNQTNWGLYKIANSGEIAPCLDEASYPEIRGFVCQGTFTPGPTDTTPPQPPQGLTLTALP